MWIFHMGCLLEAIIKLPSFMLLLGLWRDWNNFDLFENTAQGVKMQKLVVSMQLTSLS